MSNVTEISFEESAKPAKSVEKGRSKVDDVRACIATLAQRHGVVYVHHEIDVLADTITQLSDDVVVRDHTLDLIVALKRARVIDGQAMVTLAGNYLDACRAAQLDSPKA